MTLNATKFGPLKRGATSINNFFIQRSSSPDLDDITIVYDSTIEKRPSTNNDDKGPVTLPQKRKLDKISSKKPVKASRTGGSDKKRSKKETNSRTDAKQTKLDFKVPVLRRCPIGFANEDSSPIELSSDDSDSETRDSGPPDCFLSIQQSECSRSSKTLK